MMSKLNICRILLCFLGMWNLSDADYIGCYVDKSARSLPHAMITSNAMTHEMCISHCKAKGFQYAGLQYYSECHCGNKLPTYGLGYTCNLPCKGNKEQMCGGMWQNSVFSTGKPNQGCYVDKTTARGLPHAYLNVNQMTQQVCIEHCNERGYKYAGVQYYSECYCGNTLPTYGKVAESKCNTPCRGNKEQMCGGSSLNLIFTTSGNMGCYVEDALPNRYMSEPGLTKSACASFCRKYRGFKFAGIQHSVDCFCGNSLPNNGKVPDRDCETHCMKVTDENCGGKYIYRTLE